MAKKNKYIFLIFILFMSIGFAILLSSLNIGSNIVIGNASFNVYLYSPGVINTNTEGSTYQINNSRDEISFIVNLDTPGDYVDFDFYVVNDGTIDALLNSYTISGLSSKTNYVSYSLTYYSGEELSINDFLKTSTSKRMKFHIEYRYDVNDFIDTNVLQCSIAFKYIQPTISTNIWDYDYSEIAQTFIAPKNGRYKIETWGAQGGTSTWDNQTISGGYGGYSTGIINLAKNDSLHIMVGGEGSTGYQIRVPAGYNGGGYAGISSFGVNASGGGATSIYLDADVTTCLGIDVSVNRYFVDYEYIDDSIILSNFPNGYFYTCANFAKNAGDYYKVEWIGSGLSNSKLTFDTIYYPVDSSNYYAGGATEINRNVKDNIVEIWYYITNDSKNTEFRLLTHGETVQLAKQNVIKLNNPLIVSGGGGGTHIHPNSKSYGGNAGGYIGSSPVNIYQGSNNCTPPTGGTQSSGGAAGYIHPSNYDQFIKDSAFAVGGSFIKDGSSSYGAAGGGGYYGGGVGVPNSCCSYSGAGGSGYIGSSILSDKVMYCYNCSESNDTNTKTISTTNVSRVPTSCYAKIGHGYARITYLG